MTQLWFICFWLIATSYVSYAWNVSLHPNEEVTIHMGDTLDISYNITDQTGVSNFDMKVWSDDEQIVKVTSINASKNCNQGCTITLYGSFLGVANVMVSDEDEKMVQVIHVRVIRKVRAVDKAFTASVAILVSLIYVNFGCALDLVKVISILRRPIGPCIGLFGQFLVMPLLSYGLGLMFFPDRADMRLGLLFTGVSPGGGASNVWTCVLDGNIDMSVAMTTVSTFVAFGMMPFWLFTLGPHVFKSARVAVPYGHIGAMAGALIIPLAVGCALRKWAPRIANPLARALKSLSTALILFIIIFATVTNLHLFSLFTWRIVISGLALPFCGYIISWAIARWIARQNFADTIAIAIETGIQNTGIAIFLLRFGLPQPQADLTTIVPVSVAMMTPVPLMLLWLGKRIHSYFTGKRTLLFDSRPSTPRMFDTEITPISK